MGVAVHEIDRAHGVRLVDELGVGLVEQDRDA
jgi:hypothetical protein